jgi:hypothetical protein
MIEDLYTEKLNWFKRNERPEAVLLVADNPDLVKIIVAWTSLDIKHADELAELSGDSEREVWDWLWQNTRFSIAELKEKAGIPLADWVVEKKIKPLIGNRIIYPDGMVNSFVERYFRERVIKLFERSKKARK